MFKIDNMSVKNYIIDRVYIFFKPLLCCTNFGKKYEKNTCDICPVEVFSEEVISILKLQPEISSEGTLNTNVNILKSRNMEIIPLQYIELIKNK